MAEETPQQPDKDKDTDLSLIRRRLYARDEPAELQRRQQELQSLGITRRTAAAGQEPGTITQARYKNLAVLRARRLGRVLGFSGLLAVVLLVVGIGVAATVWYRSTQTVTESQVSLAVAGPQEFTAGDEIIYIISYANGSWVNWANVELVVTPPRGFTFRGSNEQVEQVGRQVIFRREDLSSRESGELHVRGQLIGEQNETAVAQAELVITPENFPSGRFTKTAVLATTITALPLDVSLDIPGDAASGERVLATISVRNLSDTTLAGVYLRPLPAPEIQLALGDSQFSQGFDEVASEWLLPDLAPLEEVQRTIVFHVDGQPGEKRIMDIEAGIRQGSENFVQRELTHVVTISATEVVVDQTYNGSPGPLTVRPGEEVAGQITYRNVGSVGLKEVIMKVTFEGASFDASSLNLGGVGSYDPTTRTVTWSSATVPELAVVQPQQQSVLNYSFKIAPLEQFPTSGEATKNHVLVTTATVDSPDLPTPVGQPRQVISDRAVLSVKTDLILAADAVYDDGRLGIKSTGPLPPRVGQTTTYTVRFRIGTTINDTADVQLLAVLPDGVRYTGQKYSTGGDVRFNERSGELTWTMPFMEGLTGRARPYNELHVQVAITPGENTRGQAVHLLNRLELSAVDQFTDEAVTAALSQFPSTASAVAGKGTVE
jgi:hypothetical protein